MEVILFRTFSHVIIMKWKVDPHTDGGAGILIKEGCIKAKGLRLSKKLDWYGVLLHSDNTDLRMGAAVFASKLLLLFLGQKKKKFYLLHSQILLHAIRQKDEWEEIIIFTQIFRNSLFEHSSWTQDKIKKTFLSEISRIRIPRPLPPPSPEKRKKL